MKFFSVNVQRGLEVIFLDSNILIEILEKDSEKSKQIPEILENHSN